MQEKIKIEDWMKLVQTERQQHIDLTTECEYHTYIKERNTKGGIKRIGDLYSDRGQMIEAKKRLLEYLNIEEFIGDNIQLCHKCDCNSCKNKICINPLHTYFGTISENTLDKPKELRSKPGYSVNCAFQQKIECPHCGKIGQLANMKRDHFDKCKKFK